jgi:transposase
MIGSTRAIRVFARTTPTDLRKGFDGLYGLVRNEFGQNPLDGDLFLFVNRRRTSAKVLHWDGTGLCIYGKRLSKGRFTALWACASSGVTLALTRTELSLFLEGADLTKKLPLSPEETRF